MFRCIDSFRNGYFSLPTGSANKPSARSFETVSIDNASSYLHTTTGIFLVHENQLVFPYCAYSGTTSTGERGMYHGAAVGMATLRRDGFASMEARNGKGSLTTRTVTFSGSHLFANLDAPEGSLTVEILDPSGEPIARSHPLSGDSTRSLISWEKRDDLEAFKGEKVRFRFSSAMAHSMPSG